MGKKLTLSLVPLFAVAAFVVMPAAAQATPHHWSVNGVQVPEGEKVQTVTWGTLALESAAGKVECQNVIGGYVENPAGGGAGKDAITAFTAYNCVSGCPVEIKIIAEGLPWPTELVEIGGKIKDQTKGAKLLFSCVFEGTSLLHVVFSGNNDPAPTNGTAAGKPSEDRYAGTGEEELQSEDGPGKTEGKVKTQGYNGTELITQK